MRLRAVTPQWPTRTAAPTQRALLRSAGDFLPEPGSARALQWAVLTPSGRVRPIPRASHNPLFPLHSHPTKCTLISHMEE